MNQKLDVALRVMTALHERTDPIQLDLESLKSWVAPPDRATTPTDLACMIILAELQRMKGENGGATA